MAPQLDQRPLQLPMPELELVLVQATVPQRLQPVLVLESECGMFQWSK